MKKLLLIGTVAALVSCGGGDSNDDGPRCTGVFPEDQQLTQLECGSTTLAEAKQILGEPSVEGTRALQYDRTCSSPLSSRILDLEFSLTDGTLSSLRYRTMGTDEPLPDISGCAKLP